MLKFTNAINLYNPANPRSGAHFTLREFMNADGLCMVHPTLLEGLYEWRAALNRTSYSGPVGVRITCAIRTRAENEALAVRLGWTDEGGAVARESKHLPEFGGIAADCVPIFLCDGRAYPTQSAADLARKYFDFVKSDYPDGHIHVDQRDRAPRLG